MATTTGIRLTKAGEALLAKIHKGETHLKISSFVIGDHVWSEKEIEELTHTRLVNQRLSAPVTEIVQGAGLDTGRVILGGTFSNHNITDFFYVREIGLMAEDPELGEILYTIDPIPENIPTTVIEANTVVQEIPIRMELVAISRDKVELTISDTRLLVDVKMLNQAKEEIYSKMDERLIPATQEDYGLTRYATVEEAIEGFSTDSVIRPETLAAAMGQYGNFGSAFFIEASTVSDLNNLTESGDYYYNTEGAANIAHTPVPTLATFLRVIKSKVNSGHGIQMAYITYNSSIYYRQLDINGWSDWCQVYPSTASATDAQAIAGTEASVTLSPANLKAAMGQFGLFGQTVYVLNTSIYKSVDEFLDTGFFYISSGATEMDNRPTTASFYLQASNGGVIGGNILQRATSATVSVYTWERQYYYNTKLWGNWIQRYPVIATATDAQALTGTNTTTTLSPANLKAAMGQFGGFGSAKNYRDLSEITSYDDIRNTGFYCVTPNSVANSPMNYSGWYLFVNNDAGTDYVSQLAIQGNGGDSMYLRKLEPDRGWTEWKQVYPALPTATSAQAIAGTDTMTTLSPANLKAALDQFGLFGFSRTNGITNLNDLKETGAYSVAYNVSNIPITGANWHIHVTGQVLEPDYRSVVSQLAIQHDGTSIYYRTYYNTTWNSWKQLYPAVARTSAPTTRTEEIFLELEQIDTEYRTLRTIASAAMGDRQAKKRLKKAEELCVPLRKELATLQAE